jgi:phi13 family phage major tail protein
MANKIKYGIKSCYYAPVTAVAADGTLTYDTPVAMPGAVSISLAPQGSSDPFYADNVVYWKGSANNGYEGDLELALIPDHFRTAILGETLDTSGFYVETADDTQTEFALLFQFEGDDEAVRHCLYRCTATRADVAGSTKEDAISPQTETITISALARINDGVIKSRCPESATTAYAAWFTTVQEPA